MVWLYFFNKCQTFIASYNGWWNPKKVKVETDLKGVRNVVAIVFQSVFHLDNTNMLKQSINIKGINLK
jgi:hypothetical protein